MRKNIKFQKYFISILIALFAIASGCRTLNITKYYTTTDKNILPNVETKFEYESDNLFYLNQLANLKFLYKRAKQDLITDATMIYYNELEKFHIRTGDTKGQLQVKIKNVNLKVSGYWTTIISGLTFCTLNLFGFPIQMYKCNTNLEIMILDNKQTLLGIYPGNGTGKGYAGLYFNYSIIDAQKKAHLESFKNAISDALNKIENNKTNLLVKLNSKQEKEVSTTKNEVTKTESKVTCDVDSIPDIKVIKKTNRFALVIGNEDYTKYQNDLSTEANVEFAKNDALTFASYCKKVFGVPDENIIVLTDAIGSQMKREIEKISKLAKFCNGEAEIIFYYAGHGFPDEESKDSYLIPCDISGSQVKEGIKLTWLYEKLTENSVKRVTVFLDACFSGGARNKALISSRGIKIVPRKADIPAKLIVISASSSDQSAYPFKDKQHGLFSYFLFKKLKETNGSATYKELFDYLYSNVGKNSLLINNSEQEPSVSTNKETEEFLNTWRIIE